jgi:hypothetical protein
MTEKLIPWAETKPGNDGKVYGVRYLLTREEKDWLQLRGVIGEVAEVVGMQAAADALVAQFERDAMVYEGGRVQ